MPCTMPWTVLTFLRLIMLVLAGLAAERLIRAPSALQFLRQQIDRVQRSDMR